MPITYPSFTLPNQRRPDTYAVLRSLVSIVQVDQNGVAITNSILDGVNEVDGQIVINFPCMPDQIELARTANFTNVTKTPNRPDGYHTYVNTEPLKIPLTFRLSAYDDYCDPRHGPLVLLAMAAKLHALCMPIAASLSAQSTAPSTSGAPTIGGSEQAQKAPPFTAGYSPEKNPFAWPPACNLDIMMAQVGGGSGQTAATNNGVSMGINCNGFIMDVRVVFSGPWLQGSFKDAGTRNLPTMAEFSFTFVHQPGYTNAISKQAGKDVNIYTTARDIYNRLYNTADLNAATGFTSLIDYDPTKQVNGLIPATTRLAR